MRKVYTLRNTFIPEYEVTLRIAIERGKSTVRISGDTWDVSVVDGFLRSNISGLEKTLDGPKEVIYEERHSVAEQTKHY